MNTCEDARPSWRQGPLKGVDIELNCPHCDTEAILVIDVDGVADYHGECYKHNHVFAVSFNAYRASEQTPTEEEKHE